MKIFTLERNEIITNTICIHENLDKNKKIYVLLYKGKYEEKNQILEITRYSRKDIGASCIVENSFIQFIKIDIQ